MTDKTIKSVRRVFEIFELFDQHRHPLSAKEISDALGYPLASAHALMKSMHELGYVDFDAPKWTYIPSRKFSLLPQWMAEFIEHETRLIECMQELNKETRETINLSRLSGRQVKIIHGLESLQPVGVSVKVGTLMPATQSLTGMTALASLGDDEFSAFVDRHGKDGPNGISDESIKLIGDVRRELEESGTVARSDVFIQGIGAVCLPILTHIYRESMVIGVVGPSDRISRNEAQHRRQIKKVISAFGINSQFKLRNNRKSR